MQTILDAVRSRHELSIFSAAAKVAGMESVLAGRKPITLFAPRDEAFSRFREEDFDRLLEHPELLARLLAYHVADRVIFGDDLRFLVEAATLEGGILPIACRSSATVARARILECDILCANGIVHVIDRILCSRSLTRALPFRFAFA